MSTPSQHPRATEAQSAPSWAVIHQRDWWLAVAAGLLTGLWFAPSADKSAPWVAAPLAALATLFALGALRWVVVHARVLIWLVVAGASVWAMVAFGSMLAAPAGGVPAWIVVWLVIEMSDRNSRPG